MRFRIVAGGKIREKYLRTAINEYLDRLKHYLPVDIVEVPQGRGAKVASAIERALPPRYELWVLDAAGKEPTSRELARWIEQRMTRGTKGVALVIGGNDGIPQDILSRAELRLSLSRMTLPHRLARLVLAEQLYRAMTIIRGEPYDK